MVAYEIDDIVAPVVDFTFEETVFLTAGVTGTVINRRAVIYTEDTVDDIYTYQISYTSPIEGTTPESETVYLSVFWFESDELGIYIDPTLDGTISTTDASNSVSLATSAASTSSSVVEGLLPTIKSSTIKDSISNYLTAVNNAKTTLDSASIDSQDFPTEQLSSYDVSVKSEYMGNDTVILQEASENLAQIQAVIDQNNEEIANFSSQSADQAIRGREASEQDFNTYVNTYAISTTDPRIPSDVSDNPIVLPSIDTDALEQAVDAAAITPAVEDEFLF